MNIKEIEKLLEKYYEGETSLQEEHHLREFFLSSEVPVHLQEHKPMFVFYTQESQEQIKSDFQKKLLRKLQTGTTIRHIVARRQFLIPLSIAATFILLFGLAYTFRMIPFRANPQPYGTISDPQLAYIETRKALLLVSENLNLGINQAKQLESFQKGLETAEKFSELDKYQPIIIKRDNKQK